MKGEKFFCYVRKMYILHLETPFIYKLMGLPWVLHCGQYFSGIFMVHLERSLLSYLQKTLVFGNNMWITQEIGTVDHSLSMINNFHPNNIQLTYETEYNCKLAFLDVMLCRDGENIATTVYQKVYNTDVYLIPELVCPT